MKPVIRDFFEEWISIDAFAGGAGAATGSKAATGRAVDVAINHDPVAIAVFQDNNPETECYRADVFSVDPMRACRGRRVLHFHMSPDCRHHSRAKGGRPVSASVRALADVGIDWARAVKPVLITLENVPEFVEWGPVDEKGRVIKERKGEEFRRWCGELEALGYAIEWRVLHAYHYGAPTSRKRLFLVARCDGKPICWPEPTHGSPAERKKNPKLKPWRTAAECIDWSIPAPSIFDRKKPLAKATLRRVAEGIRRFVLESAKPFVISIDHQSAKNAERSIHRPVSTISTKARHALVAPTLVQTSYGERKGQAPRVLDLHKPLGTIVAGGVKHALVETKLASFLSQYNLGQVGHELTKPLPTITAIDHHALVNVEMVPVEFAEQFPNAPKVYAFLAAYYGEGSGKIGHPLTAPLPTITTRDRFALVTVTIDGEKFAIVDIGLRMLEPHELLKAQFGEFARTYRLDKATTKKAQVRLIGNSVVPHMQRAVVAANLGSLHPQARRAA